METLGKPRGLVPLEDSKDCSHGLCTIFCPQWCYLLFSPPPPFSLSEDESSGTPAFSPLVIGIIGILGAAFLLLSYYTLVTKYRNATFFRRQRHQNNDQQEEESVVQSQRQESWHLPSTNGLDEELISKITVCFYKTGEGLVDGTDCSVCLAEFRDGDSLRLLPKCSHAFHLHCIDTWLKSQSNCPLCRAGIVVQSSDLESRVPPALEVVEDLYLDSNGEEEEEEEEEDGESEVCKDFQVIEIGEEDGRLLTLSFSTGSPSTSDGGGKNSKGRRETSRGLHSVMSPVRMKRSVSSGRSCLTRKGRGVRFFCFEETQQKSDGEEASLRTSPE